LATRIWKQRRWIFFSIFCAVILAALKPAYGQLIKNFIDQGLNSKDWAKLLGSCAFLITATAIDNLAEFGHRFSLRVSIERLILLLRREVFAKFITLSQASTRDRTTGQAMTHTLQDSQVVGLGMNVLADLVREPLVLVGLMGYLFYTNWLLTLVCLVTLPFVGIVGKVFAKSARRNQSRLQNTIEQMSQHVVESINGIRTAHHLDQTGKLMNEFEDRSGQAYGFLVRLARIEELVGPMTKWTTAWIGVVLIGFGGYLVVEGDLTTGAFVSQRASESRISWSSHPMRSRLKNRKSCAAE
jgi:subfamily B ATP-binding cassette protein MsbA